MRYAQKRDGVLVYYIQTESKKKGLLVREGFIFVNLYTITKNNHGK